MLAMPLDPRRDPLADLFEVMNDLQAEDLRFHAGGGLGSRLKALSRSINRLEAEAARTLEVFDRANAYEADGSRSAPSNH